MKHKKFCALLLSLLLSLFLLSLQAQAANGEDTLMTSGEFVAALKKALERETVYPIPNIYPRNCGYYDGTAIGWDCSNLGKTIIWSRGAVVDNYTAGAYEAANTLFGLKDWGTDTLRLQGNVTDTDFTTLIPGEWLWMPGHLGYYIGDGQVVESTVSWGANGVILSTVDDTGKRSRNGISASSWIAHGKVPWLDYSDYDPALTLLPCALCVKLLRTSALLDRCSLSGTAETLRNAVSGDVLETDGLIRDSDGCYWYSLRDEAGYLYAGDTLPVSPAGTVLRPEDFVVPTAIHEGEATPFQGVLAATGSFRLSRVSVELTDEDGRLVRSYCWTGDNTACSLGTLSAENALSFETLKPGAYILELHAQVVYLYSDGERLLNGFTEESVDALRTELTVLQRPAQAMTAQIFVRALKKALDRSTAYCESRPGNLGLYSNGVISWDKRSLGKTIIWSDGAIADNYIEGAYEKNVGSHGLGNWDSLTVLRCAPNFSNDFSLLCVGEWLTNGDALGYYIGNGQVIECTADWDANGVTISEVNARGERSRNGILCGSWLFHGMVPWLDYSHCNHTHAFYITEYRMPNATDAGMTGYSCACGDGYRTAYIPPTES